MDIQVRSRSQALRGAGGGDTKRVLRGVSSLVSSELRATAPTPTRQLPKVPGTYYASVGALCRHVPDPYQAVGEGLGPRRSMELVVHRHCSNCWHVASSHLCADLYAEQCCEALVCPMPNARCPMAEGERGGERGFHLPQQRAAASRGSKKKKGGKVKTIG